MTVTLDAVPSAADLRPVRLASLDYEPQGTTLRNLEVYRWGKFDETDRANLADSLEDTLKAAIRGMRPSGAPVEIHVLIRTYFIAATGREGLVIAGVDWCTAEPDKRVLFQDAFYAAYTCGRFPNICTMGINKDAVHGAIVKRIAQDALAAAAGIRPDERAVAKTYSKFEGKGKDADADRLEAASIARQVARAKAGATGKDRAGRSPAGPARLARRPRSGH
jgi:hypothetical protein